MLSFELEERENKFAIFHCHRSAAGAEGADFFRLLLTQVTRLGSCPELKIVIDLKDKAEIDSETLEKIAGFGQQLVAMKRKIYLVNVPEQTTIAIKTRGMDTYLHTLYSSPVKTQTVVSKAVLDTEAALIDALQEGLRGVCDMFCAKLSFQPKPAYVKKEAETLPCQITGTLKLRSKTFDGEIVLTFPEATYLKVMSAMHETSYTNLAEVADDGASETLNILRSLARKRLFEKGYMFDKEIPAVTRGDLTEKLLRNYSSVLVIPFDSPQGTFYCQVGMTPRKTAA